MFEGGLVVTRVREGSEAAESQDGITRRRAVGYLIAAPFLVAGARFVNPPAASAAGSPRRSSPTGRTS